MSSFILAEFWARDSELPCQQSLSFGHEPDKMAGDMLFATHSGLGERCYEDTETK